MNPKVSEKEFIELWMELKSGAKVAKRLDIDVSNVMRRRRYIEGKLGIILPSKVPSKEKKYQYRYTAQTHKSAINLGIENGCVIVFSDAHFWPANETAAYRGLVKLIEEIKPKAVICNGDAFDGASISRHDKIMWEKRPTVIEELKACEIYLGTIDDTAKKANKQCKLIWTLGNHDQRFESRIANTAPEYAQVHGVHLKDHFPYWDFGMAAWVNESTIVKHRWHNGVHAAYNNALKSGKSIVTGHLHSLKVTPWTDYLGNRYGVDTGTLAEPYGDQFDYTELSPVNWRSGFVVLTFHNGRLLLPELCQVFDSDHVEFRGQIIPV